MEKLDFLIVGQGIAGSLLAHELLKAGKDILVIDSDSMLTSSHKAAGLYNPITGRKMIKTWMADEIFPTLESYYQDIEKTYNANFLFPKTIYRPFHAMDEVNDWESKAQEPGYLAFIKEVKTRSQEIKGVLDPFGGLMLKCSGYVDLPKMISVIRKRLLDLKVLSIKDFKYEELTISNGEVSYNNISAKRVIFCEGPGVKNNPYWNHLPFRPVKGEIMDIKCDLPANKIINRGVFMLPKDGVFRVGSTYDHENLDFIPTETGINSLKKRLTKLYDGGYEVVATNAGVRPATYDRRPIIGNHPKYEVVGIFNGFGTKGVSLVPYFARQYVNYLLGYSVLDRAVNVERIELS